MGQHKYNETAIQAKAGLITPKPKNRISKRERDAYLYKAMKHVLNEKGIPTPDQLSDQLGLVGEYMRPY